VAGVSDAAAWRQVVLLGFMGAGKSTVGPLLAQALEWEFVDLDREIEVVRGARVAEIFAAEGEPAFRAAEAEVSRRALQRERVVVAVGGGWVENPGVSWPLPEESFTVWLDAPEVEILRRLGPDAGRTRPLLSSANPAATVAELLRRRRPLYGRAALRVETAGRTPGAVVEEIVASLRAARAPGRS
jgi:shikimate kinase